MAYSELVKRFDLVRDYMRDFLIFGFKTREDFDRKSGRTYDNERRRIESWLGDSLRWEYRAGGKALFLSLDAGTLSRNPLYRAWQSKSFTDNDILLHFFLLDLLADGRPRHAEAITDELLEAYDQVFEPLTVRPEAKGICSAGNFTYGEAGPQAVLYTRVPFAGEPVPRPNQSAGTAGLFRRNRAAGRRRRVPGGPPSKRKPHVPLQASFYRPYSRGSDPAHGPAGHAAGRTAGDHQRQRPKQRGDRLHGDPPQNPGQRPDRAALFSGAAAGTRAVSRLFGWITSRKRRLCRERKGTRPAKRWPSRFSPDPGERPFRAAAGGSGFP